MRKNNIILIILLSFIISGCSSNDRDKNTIYYDLDIGTYYKENINILLDRNAYKIADDYDGTGVNLEIRTLYEDIYPIFGNSDILYNRKIDKNLNNVVVNLNYNYIEDDFIYSNYMMNCFENYDIVSNDDSVEINLSGEFYCLYDKENINIKVNTDFNVIESNGMFDDSAYVWEINKDNINSTNIRYVVSRNYDGMIKDRDSILISNKNNKNNLNLVKIVILFLILILLIFAKNRYDKKNEML